MSLVGFPGGDKLEKVACWHCTGSVETAKAVRIPVDEGRGKHLYGFFCSFPCAKRFCIDDGCRRHELSRCILGLTVSAGCTDIGLAPPRIALRKFGGPLTSAEFKAAARDSIVQVVSGRHMQMALKNNKVNESPGRQRQDGLFHEFMRKHRFQLHNDGKKHERRPPRRKRASKGTLRGFFRNAP